MSSDLSFNIEQIISDNLLSFVKSSIVAIDVNWKIIYWNKGSEIIFGYTKDEIIGKLLKVVFPTFSEDLLINDLDNIKNGGSVISEWEGVHKSGKQVWVNQNTSVLKDKKDKVIGFIGISNDISDQKRNFKYKTELLNIIEHSEDGIESMDLDGNILSWNKGAERIYGYSCDEMVGENAVLLYPEYGRDELQRILEVIKSGKSVELFETKRRNKNNILFDVNMSFSPLKDEKGNIYGLAVITKDITELKKTAKKLRSSELKYQTIFENSGEGLLLMDDKFIDCNKKLCLLWGYDKDEIIGKSPGFFSPKYQPDGTLSEKKAKIRIDQVYKDGSVNFYWQHITKHKKKLETRISLNKVIVEGKQQIIAVVQDLSELFKYQNKLKAKSKELVEQNKEILFLNEELKETNNRLKIINNQIEQSEKKFRAAFKTSLDAILITQLSDGRCIEVNEGFVNITGFAESEIINKTSKDINLWVDSNDRDRLLEVLAQEGKVHNLEIKYRIKDGPIITGLTSANVIEIRGVEHVISITRDITQRKKYEVQLKEATKKAEESDMLKSAFLANMSHEIRTPMNAILGFSQLLKEKELEREKQNKFLDIIVSRSKNLLQIINDIIDISKIEANQLKIDNYEFSLKKTFYEIHTFFEAELYTLGKTDLKFEFNSEFNEYTSNIKSDEVRLKQIITNLISNSIKFTNKGKIEFGYSLKGNNLEFFVRDTGVGIPKEAQKYVFERFRQADDSSTREFGGTGLGLAICKQLAEKLGGKIWFASEEDKGTVFYFTIPFQPTKTMTMEKETKPLGLIDLTGKKVLIVEDDLISMTYLEELLAGTNATIIKATDGTIAVSKFKENLDIDIILMDVYLPTMSGNEATREIKTINPNVPVIMQSAYAMPSDKKESFKYGCDDYVTKPIDNRVLMYTIKKHLR
jgi:PAS domain S-box-containing protein